MSNLPHKSLSADCSAPKTRWAQYGPDSPVCRVKKPSFHRSNASAEYSYHTGNILIATTDDHSADFGYTGRSVSSPCDSIPRVFEIVLHADDPRMGERQSPLSNSGSVPVHRLCFDLSVLYSGKTINRRAVCGRSARTVRRGGRPGIQPVFLTPIRDSLPDSRQL